MNLRTSVFAAGLFALSVSLGFVAGLAMIAILGAVLPSFRPNDDDTMREFVPAALAYSVWGATTLVTLAFGWRRIRRVR
jgi:cytochrome bd-type quinol oxidase subunit 1